MRFLGWKNIELLPLQLYSLDISPDDFFLFETMKSHLKFIDFPDSGCLDTWKENKLNTFTNDSFFEVFKNLREQWNPAISVKRDNLGHCKNLHFIINSFRISQSISLHVLTVTPKFQPYPFGTFLKGKLQRPFFSLENRFFFSNKLFSHS